MMGNLEQHKESSSHCEEFQERGKISWNDGELCTIEIKNKSVHDKITQIV